MLFLENRAMWIINATSKDFQILSGKFFDMFFRDLAVYINLEYFGKYFLSSQI